MPPITSVGVAVSEADHDRLDPPGRPGDEASFSVAGLPIVVSQDRGVGSAKSRRPGPYLHHVSCLVADLESSTEDFRRSLDLRTVFDFSKSGEGGFRLLADSSWDEECHEFTIEPIAGPAYGPEQPWWDAHGSHWDHICFVCADVEEVFERGLSNQMAPMLPPRVYPEYGLTIAWLYGPRGLHVELMSPVGHLGLRQAFDDEEVANAWSDDYVRELDWLPAPSSA